MNVWRDFDGAVTNRSRDARQAGFVSLNPSKKSGEVIRKTGISDSENWSKTEAKCCPEGGASPRFAAPH